MDILNDNTLTELLSSFSCKQDPDIEYFLHHKAIKFETLSKSRTYLIFNQEDFQKYLNYPVIYGYISLALKTLILPARLSNQTRRKLDGLSSKNHGQQINDIPCYLIGQLSKNSNITVNPITGKDLLHIAYDIITSASKAVGGRYMMIECRNQDELILFYQNNFFSEINRTLDEGQSLVQMIRKIT